MPLPFKTDDLDRLDRVVRRLLASPDGLREDLPALLQGWLSEAAITVLEGVAGWVYPPGLQEDARKEATAPTPDGLDAREATLVGVLEPLLRAHAARRTGAARVDRLRATFGLTPRQAEVALLLARRASNAEVARALGISPHTARRHTEATLAKLGLADRRRVAGLLSAFDPDA